MTSANNKSIMIGIGALIVLTIAYFLFFSGSGTTADLTTESAAGSSAELYFVTLVGSLNPIAFDTQVLSDPRFAALVDIRTALIPETSGRPDPFAPIAGVKSAGK